MTFPITDGLEAMACSLEKRLARLEAALCTHDWKLVAAWGGSGCRGGRRDRCVKCGSEQTRLDERRVGDKDRRKVRDCVLPERTERGTRRIETCGRRKSDIVYWRNLPLSEPPIPVSEGWWKVYGKSNSYGLYTVRREDRPYDEGFTVSSLDDGERLAKHLNAMEAKRIEERKGKGAPYGAEGRIYRHMTDEFVPNQRSGHDRRKGGK